MKKSATEMQFYPVNHQQDAGKEHVGEDARPLDAGLWPNSELLHMLDSCHNAYQHGQNALGQVYMLQSATECLCLRQRPSPANPASESSLAECGHACTIHLPTASLRNALVAKGSE